MNVCLEKRPRTNIWLVGEEIEDECLVGEEVEGDRLFSCRKERARKLVWLEKKPSTNVCWVASAGATSVGG